MRLACLLTSLLLAAIGPLACASSPPATAPAPAPATATAAPRATRPGDPLTRAGDEIIVAGQLFHTGTRVVTWLDPGGYDAYAPHRRDDPEQTLPSRPAEGCDTPSRLSSGRALAPEAAALVRAGYGLDLAALREQVTQFVVHYDVAYTSANCFHILHDVRGLSVHFMLDLDGTIYQTCDLLARARHAGAANDRSVGVEIAHPGPLSGNAERDARTWPRDEQGVYLALPETLRRGALPEDFRARPARPEPVAGPIQGAEHRQYDFTEAQYRALAHLLAALHRIFPRLRLDAPRDQSGAVSTRALEADRLAAFEGVIGHYHVTTRKTDPGPAFDWERVLREARALARD